MKGTSIIHSDQNESVHAMFEARLVGEMRLNQEPRLYPQRKRAWDKLIADIDQASSTLHFSRASVTQAGKPSN